MVVAPENQPPTDRLALLYRLSQAFNSSLDLDEVLNRVMDEVILVTQAERGFVMLQEGDRGLVFRVARGMDHSTIDDPEFQISRGVVERVAREGEPILTSDAGLDERFMMRESVMGLRLRSILCVPLKIMDRVIGAVYVENRMQAGIFVPDDCDLLTAIASNAAIAIENARLYQLAVDRGRLERELQMAHEVQAGLLPQKTPQIPGWEFAGRWQPAREVSGDYYDFIPGDEGQVGLLVADVSDKGMPAALFMALTRSTVRASVDRAASPAEGIARANRLICADATGGMFVTLFYGLLDVAQNQITYVNAGHNPPFFYSAGQDELTELARTGMAIGVTADTPFEQRSTQLSPGDFVLFYTDGVIDATNASEEDFGLERLRRVALENRLGSAENIVTALAESVGDFIGDTAQFDDVTIMVAKCLR
jgi:sigma-B regulation protein RsbU (phosphoserine phosphatase)